jgi:hypothetical protein
MATGGTVIVRDLGLTTILKNMKAFDGVALAVGIQGPEAGAIHPDSELDNVGLGVIHEFGAPGAGIPVRSWLRAAFDFNEARWLSLAGRVAEKVYETTPAQPGRALGIMGEVVVADIKKRFAQGIPPPLKQATIDARAKQFGQKSSKPLLATGALRQAVTWTVRRR